MNQSDATFELIKELTQNEKRHFRVFSKAAGKDKNYLKVFDVLDKMKTYDNKILNKKLAGTKINVSYEKNYLHKQLLKSLRTFYSETNSAIELQDILKAVEILYRKRLSSQCQKLVDKGIEISKKHEQWNYHLELIEWQYRIYGRTGNYKKIMLYEEEGLKEKEVLFESIRAYAHIMNEIYLVITIMKSQSVSAENKIKEKLKNIIAKCEILLKKHKNSFRITDTLYSTLYLASHYSGNFKKAYEYSLANYQLYNNNPHFKSDVPFKFFAVLGNLVNRCINLKKYDEGLNYVSELKLFLKNLPSFDAQDIQPEQLSAIFGYETRILASTHRYSEALKVTREFERSQTAKNLRRGTVLTDGIHSARIYFVNGLQKESLKRANELINENTPGIPLDFSTYAHLMRLCLHYDLNHHDLLEHLAQMAQRFLAKNNADDNFAFAFIDMMKQISKTDIQKKQKQIFADHHPKLKKLVKNPYEQYNDLTEWIQAKLN